MGQIEQIKAPILSEFSTFQMLYQASLRSEDTLLNSVLSYLCKTTGKQMRPILTLLFARLFGEVNDKTYHSAISLELLHTASLVHDDVVDESDRRRGKPSVNATFNNKVSVLTGDYLLSTSLLYISKTDIQSVSIVSNLGQLLAKGELLQLNNTSSKEFSIDSYFDVIRQKTAVLFSASAQLGALSVGASTEQIEIARLFGEKLGMIFQIRDDIFDYYTQDVGKPTGNDMREGKLTLPALYVLNNHADSTVVDLAVKIRSLSANEDDIKRFTEIVLSRGGVEYARRVMNEMHDEAKELLNFGTPHHVKDALLCYLDFVSARDI